MITEEIKNIKTDKKELKKFGLTLGIATFFGLVYSLGIEKPGILFF